MNNVILSDSEARRLLEMIKVSLKSAIDFINGLRDLPMKRIVADEGILAGKLIINWTV